MFRTKHRGKTKTSYCWKFRADGVNYIFIVDRPHLLFRAVIGGVGGSYTNDQGLVNLSKITSDPEAYFKTHTPEILADKGFSKDTFVIPIDGKIRKNMNI